MEQVKEQITREPHSGPHLLMPAFSTLNELIATKAMDYKLINYTPMDSIKAPMAV
jgi:thymidylate synthase